MSAQGKPAGEPPALLCYCGRPSGHTGKHVGGPPVSITPQPVLFRKNLERELAACYGVIAALKRRMRDDAAMLATHEARLKPLIALLDIYTPLRAITDESGGKPKTFTTFPPPDLSDINARTWPDEKPKPAVIDAEAEPAEDDPDDAPATGDFEPVKRDFNTIVRWATQRNLTFRTWEDLPAINKMRERLELAPFERLYGKRKA